MSGKKLYVPPHRRDPSSAAAGGCAAPAAAPRRDTHYVCVRVVSVAQALVDVRQGVIEGVVKRSSEAAREGMVGAATTTVLHMTMGSMLCLPDDDAIAAAVATLRAVAAGSRQRLNGRAPPVSLPLTRLYADDCKVVAIPPADDPTTNVLEQLAADLDRALNEKGLLTGAPKRSQWMHVSLFKRLPEGSRDDVKGVVAEGGSIAGIDLPIVQLELVRKEGTLPLVGAFPLWQ